jgi:hypothetical protein
MVAVSNVGLARRDDSRWRLGGAIDDIELWFDFPAETDPQLRAEPFLACAIFRAMWKGEPLSFDASAPLSPTILDNFWKFQAIFRQWHPALHQVEITAENLAEPVSSGRVLGTYSGGVDSNFTFLRHRDELTHLLLSDSFDHYRGGDTFEALRLRVEAFAERQEKGLVTVGSNVRDVRKDFYVSWEYLHGPILCSMASVLGARIYIPSSADFRILRPWGSHPLLDPLWSSPGGEAVHDGLEFHRSEKTVAIASDPEIVSALQVCWNSKVSNCGVCGKCARTRLVLEIIGVTGAPFPNEGEPVDISAIKIKSPGGAGYAWDLMKLAEQHGKTRIAEELRRALSGYQRRRGVEDILKGVAPRRLRALYQSRGDRSWRNVIWPAIVTQYD